MAHPMKAYRERHGLTLAQLGDFLGVTKPAVFKWERGLGPSPAMAIEIEKLTGGELPRWELRPDLWSAPQEVAE
jgi:transcriptional regulator with XRE-family HTH domain